MKHAASGQHNAVSVGGNEFADKGTVINEAIKASVGEVADAQDRLMTQGVAEINRIAGRWRRVLWEGLLRVQHRFGTPVL